MANWIERLRRVRSEGEARMRSAREVIEREESSRRTAKEKARREEQAKKQEVKERSAELRKDLVRIGARTLLEDIKKHVWKAGYIEERADEDLAVIGLVFQYDTVVSEGGEPMTGLEGGLRPTREYVGISRIQLIVGVGYVSALDNKKMAFIGDIYWHPHYHGHYDAEPNIGHTLFEVTDPQAIDMLKEKLLEMASRKLPEEAKLDGLEEIKKHRAWRH